MKTCDSSQRQGGRSNCAEWMNLSFADFENACRELSGERAGDRMTYCVRSYEEMHRHNLALASQCILFRLPEMIVYHVYCCIEAQIRAHEKRACSFTDALKLLGYMYSQYTSLIQEALPTKPAYSELTMRTLALLDRAFEHEPVPKDLGVQHIAKQLNVSPNYLSHRFVKETDITLTGYVTRKRLRRACFLLLNTMLSVTEIADRVGFADASYYCAVCKRLTGMSPTQYRERRSMPCLGRTEAFDTNEGIQTD